jgi:hypothetical protein
VWSCGSGPPAGSSASSCAGSSLARAPRWPGCWWGLAGLAVAFLAVVCVPIGVGVAVLRCRLWDLDRLISRTVTYAVVTALLVLPYRGL